MVILPLFSINLFLFERDNIQQQINDTIWSYKTRLYFNSYIHAICNVNGWLRSPKLGDFKLIRVYTKTIVLKMRKFDQAALPLCTIWCNNLLVGWLLMNLQLKLQVNLTYVHRIKLLITSWGKNERNIIIRVVGWDISCEDIIHEPSFCSNAQILY
jgi:hypothetical protein